jgi:hypothetical protein
VASAGATSLVGGYRVTGYETCVVVSARDLRRPTVRGHWARGQPTYTIVVGRFGQPIDVLGSSTVPDVGRATGWRGVTTRWRGVKLEDDEEGRRAIPFDLGHIVVDPRRRQILGLVPTGQPLQMQYMLGATDLPVLAGGLPGHDRPEKPPELHYRCTAYGHDVSRPPDSAGTRCNKPLTPEQAEESGQDFCPGLLEPA